MALHLLSVTYKDILIMLWQDPNRYRVTIWDRSPRFPKIHSVKIKRLHDRDKARIISRAFDWVRAYDRKRGKVK